MIRLISILVAITLLASSAVSQVEEITLPVDSTFIINIDDNRLEIKLSVKREEWQKVNNLLELQKEGKANDDLYTEVSSNQNERPGESYSNGETTISVPRFYGYVPENLLNWLSEHATRLFIKILEYDDKIQKLNGKQKVVLEILLLNTLKDIEELNKESIPHLSWVERKSKQNELGIAAKSDVDTFVDNLIKKLESIEGKMKGTQNIDGEWMKDMHTLIRLDREQRFSDDLREKCRKFIDGKHNMMNRKILYNRKWTNEIDDGFYYPGAKDKVPLIFSFASQDAILSNTSK